MTEAGNQPRRIRCGGWPRPCRDSAIIWILAALFVLRYIYLAGGWETADKPAKKLVVDPGRVLSG
jgi:hypothetical protein